MSKQTMSTLLSVLALIGAACEKTEEQPGGAGEAVEAVEQAAAPGSQPAPQAAAPAVVEPPAGARVFFIEPKDGALIKGPLEGDKVKVTFKMGVEGFDVKPAGEQVQGTGHHHLIVDGEHVAMGKVVPKDDTHIHFGGGQTEAELALPVGEHTVTMQFADGAHLSYGDKLSATIKINVQGEAQ